MPARLAETLARLYNSPQNFMSHTARAIISAMQQQGNLLTHKRPRQPHELDRPLRVDYRAIRPARRLLSVRVSHTKL